MKDWTLEELIDDISYKVDIRMSEEGVAEADWDDFEEDYFFAEVRHRIEHREPGWEVLLKEYGDC